MSHPVVVVVAVVAPPSSPHPHPGDASAAEDLRAFRDQVGGRLALSVPRRTSASVLFVLLVQALSCRAAAVAAAHADGRAHVAVPAAAKPASPAAPRVAWSRPGGARAGHTSRPSFQVQAAEHEAERRRRIVCLDLARPGPKPAPRGRGRKVNSAVGPLCPSDKVKQPMTDVCFRPTPKAHLK